MDRRLINNAAQWRSERDRTSGFGWMDSFLNCFYRLFLTMEAVARLFLVVLGNENVCMPFLIWKKEYFRNTPVFCCI